MRYKLDFDRFIDQAVSDAFDRYTIMPGDTSFDRVAGLSADDLLKEWGPELAAILKPAIKAEMERQLDDLLRAK